MPTLKRRAEALVEAIRGLGLRAYAPEDKGECVEFMVDCCGETFLAYIYEGRYSSHLVVKVTATPRDCGTALLDPEGLIAIGDPEGQLALNIKRKLERLNLIVKRLKHS